LTDEKAKIVLLAKIKRQRVQIERHPRDLEDVYGSRGIAWGLMQSQRVQDFRDMSANALRCEFLRNFRKFCCHLDDRSI
jgi:hypothetical protein